MSGFFYTLKGLLPELLLILTTLLILVLGVFVERPLKNNASLISLPVYYTLLVTLFLLVFLGQNLFLAGQAPVSVNYLADSFVDDYLSQFFKFFILVFFFPILISLRVYLIHERIYAYEYLILLLLSLLGAFFLVSSQDFLLFYVAIELQALSAYALTALRTDSRFSAEAGIKYFIVGVSASVLILFGIALIYGYTGTLSFTNLNLFLSADETNSRVVVLALLVFWLGLFIKVAAAPLHFWSLDVYQGSALPVTGFFSVVPKFALFGFFIRFYYEILGGSWEWVFQRVNPSPLAREDLLWHLARQNTQHHHLDQSTLLDDLGAFGETSAFKDVVESLRREGSSALDSFMGWWHFLAQEALRADYLELWHRAIVDYRLHLPALGNLEYAQTVALPGKLGLSGLFLFLGLASILVGAWGGIGQTNLKRLFAYSSLTNVGFLLLTFVPGTAQGLQAGLAYLFVYLGLASTFFLLLLVIHLHYRRPIFSLNDLVHIGPIPAGALIFVLLALAGIPPTAGFAIKYYVYYILVSGGYYVSAFLVVLASLLSIFFYLRILVVTFFSVQRDFYLQSITRSLPMDLTLVTVLYLLVTSLLLSVFVPELFAYFGNFQELFLARRSAYWPILTNDVDWTAVFSRYDAFLDAVHKALWHSPSAPNPLDSVSPLPAEPTSKFGKSRF